jgi:hypothetical protein
VTRRWPKVLIVVVVVLAGLFVAADRIAAHVAGNWIASRAKHSYTSGANAEGHVDATVHGFPFLTQAASRHLDHVTLDASDLTLDTPGGGTTGWLSAHSLHVDLRDVEVAPGYHSAVADTVGGALSIDNADISSGVTKLLSNGGDLTVGPAHSGGAQGFTPQTQVRVKGTFGGQPLDTTATVGAEGNQLEISIPGINREPARWSLGLPEGISFSGVRATSGSVEIGLTGHHVPVG